MPIHITKFKQNRVWEKRKSLSGIRLSITSLSSKEGKCSFQECSLHTEGCRLSHNTSRNVLLLHGMLV